MIDRMTFSIIAADLDALDGPEWGVAVASKFLAAGSVVPWAKAGAGAVATQALANVSYGPEGLDRLQKGEGAETVVEALTRADEDSGQRQVGIVDASGRAASFTGGECLDWAGGAIGRRFCCQGNILAGPEVIAAMMRRFEGASGPLGERLVEALAAGFRAGGDRRGMQSAALLVVRDHGGYMGGGDRAVDLRIDDHPDAVNELRRVLRLQRLYFPSPGSLDFVPIDDDLAAELRGHLRALGFRAPACSGYDDALRRALFEWVGTENLEERWADDARIEKRVLDALRDVAR
jgi:uncharacterized Ntn-hydrolase superfamily protein